MDAGHDKVTGLEGLRIEIHLRGAGQHAAGQRALNADAAARRRQGCHQTIG